MNWVTIGSGNGLSPARRQAITWTNADFMSIRTSGTNFSVIRIKIQHFSFTKMHLNLLSATWRPFCRGGDELNQLHQWYFLQPRWRCTLRYLQHRISQLSGSSCTSQAEIKWRYRSTNVTYFVGWEWSWSFAVLEAILMLASYCWNLLSNPLCW